MTHKLSRLRRKKLERFIQKKENEEMKSYDVENRMLTPFKHFIVFPSILTIFDLFKCVGIVGNTM